MILIISINTVQWFFRWKLMEPLENSLKCTGTPLVFFVTQLQLKNAAILVPKNGKNQFVGI